MLRVLPVREFHFLILSGPPGYAAVHCELLPADGAEAAVNQALIVAFSVIRHRECPGRPERDPDARESVKYSGNRVTDVGEDPRVR